MSTQLVVAPPRPSGPSRALLSSRFLTFISVCIRAASAHSRAVMCKRPRPRRATDTESPARHRTHLPITPATPEDAETRGTSDWTQVGSRWPSRTTEKLHKAGVGPGWDAAQGHPRRGAPQREPAQITHCRALSSEGRPLWLGSRGTGCENFLEQEGCVGDLALRASGCGTSATQTQNNPRQLGAAASLLLLLLVSPLTSPLTSWPPTPPGVRLSAPLPCGARSGAPDAGLVGRTNHIVSKSG